MSKGVKASLSYFVDDIGKGTKLKILPYQTTLDALNNFAQVNNIVPYRLSIDSGMVIDVNNELKGMPFDVLTTSVPFLLLKYNYINRLQLLTQWVLVNKSYDSLPSLFEFAREFSYASKDDLMTFLDKENKRIEKQLVAIRAKNVQLGSTVAKLPAAPSSFPIFQLDDVAWILLCTFPFASLLEAFNLTRASFAVPAVALHVGDKSFFKVHTTSQKIEITDLRPNALTLFVKLSKKDETRTIKTIPISISDRGEIHLTTLPGVSVEQVLDVVTRAWGGREISIHLTRQERIRGKFKLPLEEGDFIDLPVLYDLFALDDVAAFFGFIDETKKTALAKPRQYIHFSPGHTLTEETAFSTAFSSTLLLTPIDSGIELRVSRSRDLEQANSILYIFMRLKAYAAKKSKIIRDQYHAASIPLPPPMTAIQTKTKKKQGKRVRELQTARPTLFANEYSSTCQKAQQPKLIEGKKAADKYVKDFLDGNKHKVIEFPNGSGDFYVCEPREEDDTPDTYVWPGITAKDQTLFPCCFKVDQYTKAGAPWRKYIEGEAIEGNISRAVRYVLGPTKPCPQDRRGKLPLNLQELFFGKISDDRKDDSIYRIGIEASPQSFSFAVCRALFPTFGELERNKFADKFAKLLGVSRETYIDPADVVHKFETELKVHILLFSLEDRGNVVLPSSEIAYVPSSPFYEKTVVIVTANAEYDDSRKTVQCEYLESNTKSKDAGFFETKTILPIFKIVAQIAASTHLSSSGARTTRIISRHKEITAQYIDTFGMLRGFMWLGEK